MIFRIGGLLAAAALCVLVILEVSNDSPKEKPVKPSHSSVVGFKLRPADLHAGMEVVLCAKVKAKKQLEEVEFHPSKGRMSPHSRSLYKSTFSSGGKVFTSPVRLRPGCEFYRAPKTVDKEGEVVSIQLVLNGRVRDTLHLKISQSKP